MQNGCSTSQNIYLNCGVSFEVVNIGTILKENQLIHDKFILIIDHKFKTNEFIQSDPQNKT
jgi:CRISPR/Cas system-associated exonuclease Cas4 (RecB family)